MVTVILQHNYTAAKLFALQILLFRYTFNLLHRQKTHTGQRILYLQRNYTATKLFALQILLFIHLTCYQAKKNTYRSAYIVPTTQLHSSQTVRSSNSIIYTFTCYTGKNTSYCGDDLFLRGIVALSRRYDPSSCERHPTLVGTDTTSSGDDPSSEEL
jgi:hypothetical protein